MRFTRVLQFTGMNDYSSPKRILQARRLRARKRFASDGERVKIIAADALETDFQALLCAHPRARAVCGNLPYSITTPLLERIIAVAPEWDCAVVMVQREYAKRMTARPGTPDYSSLTGFVTHFCAVE